MVNILAIGAHADDVELGCGGALLKWASEGNAITIYTATDSEFSTTNGTLVRSAQTVAAEAANSANELGAQLLTGSFKCFELISAKALNSELVEVIERVDPAVILTHWDQDTHSDHRELAKATIHACRRVPTVLMYQSNHYVGATAFDGRFFVDISSWLEAKLKLIRLFESEYSRADGKWDDIVRVKAANEGHRSGVQFAEAFQVLKYLAS